ncbi:RimK family alpha-L-glutamate ligase [Lentibacillus cibarius]|uniref:RimK family alpha-L-glutamate ligase n=1 Tax=Lentibacillus cibarius TaxID=2583219 RepID=A0A549YLX0_9BACI|nr:RimK family alpha-L-glutamate ligase [Lentibacillus cibarius]TRM12837.1 RimK family alpha-L-glutamate ligase [Lentibacillus cibarius]
MDLYGWIIYNGYLKGNKFLDFAQWIQKAAAKQHIQTNIYQNNHLLSFFSSDSMTLLHTKQTELPHFVVFTDKDIYLAKQLEFLGVRVFNSAQTIALSDDKIATYQTLAANGLPIPRTVVAPKAFQQTDDINVDDYRDIANQLGLPMIVKEAFGSFGEQVHLVSTEKELFAKIQELHGKPFMLQEFISSSYGTDIRLHVVGDAVVASMKRQSSNDFRANVTAGGTMQKYHPTKQETDLAIASAKAIGADFAGVDLLFGENKEPIVCEINSNAHIRNMYNCTGINVADFIMNDIRKKLK